MHYLYKITNHADNDKVYIGQSNKETERWRQHKYYARLDEPVQYISRAMKKYGVENFTYEVVAQSLTQEGADEAEIELINQYDSRNKEKGYNVSPGGDIAWNRGLPSEQQPMYGKHHSKESKEKISESNTGKEMPLHTNEWKENMSKIMTNHLTSEETRHKISIANTGKIRSFAQKEIISFLRKGSIMSDESKRKISIANTGRAISEEHKEKLRAANTGIKRSDETKKKWRLSYKDNSSGEKNVNAKLTWLIAEKIREEYVKGNISQTELSKRYNVHKTTISNIILNKIWVLKL